MIRHIHLLSWFFLLSVSTIASAQAPVLPPGDKEPSLRLEAGGPTSYVTALAFGPDGKTLYGAGWDKVVRVWTADAAGKFTLDKAAYRIPLGPGLTGAVNAVALSDDGAWLAVAGLGVFRGGAGFRQPGLVFPSDGALSPDMRKDQGTIYVFNTRTQAARLLRGHLGPVFALAFAPAVGDGPPPLVSAAQEWDSDAARYVGAVRLWDVARTAYVDGVGGLPDPGLAGRPALSVWRTGAGPKQLRVALAWDDGAFRLWDVEKTEDAVWKLPDLKYNDTAAYDPDRKQVVTAGYGSGTARLRLWDVTAGRAPQAEPWSKVEASQVDVFPRALALVSSRADGRADLAAVVVRLPKQNNEFRLQLLDLADGSLKAEETLWKGSTMQPALATALRGGHLAVAGNEGHEVQVFSVRDLLARRGQAQPLRSVGATMHYVAFVAKDKGVGLLLNETTARPPGGPPREPADGDLVFDFAKRILTDDRTGWKAAAPAAGAWRAEAAAAKGRPGIAVSQGDRLVRRIELDAKQEITDFALLPPAPPLGVPLLAVAAHERGQPLLALYNAATGEQVRQCTGHVDRIYCLAFSADGRLLVSAAEDQTVCVWSLVNLDQIVGQHGLLTGVAVKDGDGAPVVSKVYDDSPAQGKLQKGEVIEGIVTAGKLSPLASAGAFYFAIARLKPAEKVTLRVRSEQGRRDVELDVGQAVDERKPLLSLFITRGGKVTERDWVGWNPNGPYDASGRQAERYIGWHTATDKPEQPAVFALADQYRKEYYREGILQRLLEKGRLTQDPKPDRLPPPGLTLWLDELGPDTKQRDPQGHPLLRERAATVKLAVDNFPLEQIESVTWQLGDAAAQAFGSTAGREWSADLAPALERLGWRRDLYPVRVRVRTKEATPQEYAQELTFRFQPAAPVVTLRKPEPATVEGSDATVQLAVEEPQLDLAAEVRGAVKGQQVKVRLTHRQLDKELREPKEWAAAEAQEVSEKLTLRTGENRIELVAVNADAPTDADGEQRRLVLVVTHRPKMAPVQLFLTAVGDGQESRPIEPGKPVVVHSPKVVVEGRIQATQELARADWGPDGRAGESKALTKFTANQGKTFTIREEVALDPDAHTYRFSAETAAGEKAEAVVTLDYRPRPPTVELKAPAALYEGRDPRTVEVTGRLLTPVDRRPYEYQAVVLLNGKERADLTPAIDKEAQTLTFKVPVEPGTTRLQVRLDNQWKVSTSSEPVLVRYLRPPHSIKFDEQAAVKPLLDLTARVTSALPLTAVQAEVQGESETEARRLTGTEIVPATDGVWTVRLKGVPLATGKNTVRLWAANADALSLEPGTLSLTWKEPIEPPVVEILQPQRDLTVLAPQFTLRYRIRARAPLQRVEVVRDGKVLHHSERAAKVEKGAQGEYEQEEEVALKLEPGVNALEVVAAGAGGEGRAPRAVSYLLRPAGVEILALETGGRMVQPNVQPDGGLEFPTVPVGRVRVHGRVTWSDETDPQLQREDVLVRLYVNGFQQLPTRLGPAHDGSRTFTADVVLNRSADNRIEIQADLKEKADNRRAACRVVECAQPIAGQWLHVLTVGVPTKDQDQVRARLLHALQAQAAADQALRTAAFERVVMYDTPADYVTRGHILTQLRRIKSRIQLRARAGAPNDVVLVYYQGGEAITADGHFFATSDSRPGADLSQNALRCDTLADFFAENLGAQILLLDVTRSAARAPGKDRDQVVQWPQGPNATVLRYAWLDAEGPRDLQLLKALEETMPRAVRLVDVTEGVRQFAVSSQAYPRSLAYDQYVAEEMKDLQFNRKP